MAWRESFFLVHEARWLDSIRILNPAQTLTELLRFRMLVSKISLIQIYWEWIGHISGAEICACVKVLSLFKTSKFSAAFLFAGPLNGYKVWINYSRDFKWVITSHRIKWRTVMMMPLKLGTWMSKWCCLRHENKTFFFISNCRLVVIGRQ